MSIDRRKEMRIPLILPVGCHGFGDEGGDLPKFDLSCHDLSSHGMALACESPIGTNETCRFSLPVFHSQEPLTVKGRVQWRKSLQDGNKIGVRFEEPIDLPLPFPIVEDAAARVRQDAEFYKASIQTAFSDACLWLNRKGEILQYDQRLLSLLDCSDLELTGKYLPDLFHPEDQASLGRFLVRGKRHQDASPFKGTFRLPPQGGEGERFCQITMLAKPPWSGAIEVYLKDVTQSYHLEEQNRRLEKMVGLLSGTTDETLVVLASDLTIEEVRGRVLATSSSGATSRFKGMHFQKATALAEVMVNGKSLHAHLRSCVESGRALAGRPIGYWEPMKKGRDLFSVGDYRLSVVPVPGRDKKVSALIMAVKPDATSGILELKQYGLGREERFVSILGASANGFFLERRFKEMCRSLIHLLAQLDLYFYKAGMGEPHFSDGQSESGEDQYVGDRGPVQALADALSDGMKSTLRCLPEVGGLRRADRSDIDTCLSLAVTLVGLEPGAREGQVSVTTGPDLPAGKVDEHELIMTFVIFLLLSKTCLASVSDQTIRCDRIKEKNRVLVKISHNSYIQEEAYLKILFSSHPLQRYFSNAGTLQPMETLLHYVCFLLKKNRIHMKLTNVPGQFELCLSVPVAESSI